MATNAGRKNAGYFGKDENGEGVLNLEGRNGKTRLRLRVDIAGLAPRLAMRRFG